MNRIRPGLWCAVACVGYIAGVAGASWNMPMWTFLVSACFVFVLFCHTGLRVAPRNSTGSSIQSIHKTRESTVITSIFAVFVCMGMVRYVAVQPSAQSVFTIANNKEHTITGTIVRIQETEETRRFTLDRLIIDEHAQEDRVLVSANVFAQERVGDRVQISCNIKRPEAFDDFAYDRFLAAKRIYALCKTHDTFFVTQETITFQENMLAQLAQVKQATVAAIDQVLPDPHAQLLAGLLIGDDAFSRVWNERFLKTGTSHIVAASGSNVALVWSMTLGLFFTLGIKRKYATACAFVAIAGFVFLAGAEAAAVRAGIMASLVLCGRAVGRSSKSVNIFLVAICIMLVDEPRMLRDDVGFQLSVCSTAGLMFLSDWAKARLIFLPKAFGLRESCASTLAATLATFPVVLTMQDSYAVLGIAVNAIILPLIPYTMALGTGATVLGLIAQDVGIWSAVPVWLMLDIMLTVMRESAALSFAQVPRAWAGIFFAASIAGYLVIKTRKKHVPQQKIQDASFGAKMLICGYGILACVVLVLHIARDGWFSKNVRVWVFDVGQGDGILIDTAQDDVIIDGGPSFVMREKIGTVLPPTTRHVAWTALTHPHADHAIGLISTAQHYTTDHVIESGQGCATPECAALSRVTQQDSHQILPAGTVFTLAPNVTLEVLLPETHYNNKKLSDPNDGSVVLLLSTPNGSMLFMGDAGEEEEAQILRGLPQEIDVLKVGHHGSKTSTSSALLEKITPTYAIISAGKNNVFHHPHQEVLKRLDEHKSTVARTDLLGDILVEFSENGVMVRGENL